jgi:hypothetical protein
MKSLSRSLLTSADELFDQPSGWLFFCPREKGWRESQAENGMFPGGWRVAEPLDSVHSLRYCASTPKRASLGSSIFLSTLSIQWTLYEKADPRVSLSLFSPLGLGSPGLLL